MKKLILFACIATTISFASCSKKSTCTCTTSIDGEAMMETTVEVDGDCSDGNSKTTMGEMVTEVSCK